MRGIDVQDIGAEIPIIYQDGLPIRPGNRVERRANSAHSSQDVSCESCYPILFQWFLRK